MTLNKKSLRLVTHIVTGNKLLNGHQITIGNMTSALCECKEDMKTSYHFVAECPKHFESRFKHFGKPILDPEDMVISSKNHVTLGKGLDGIVEDDILFYTKLSKKICPLLQGNRTTLHEFQS